MMRFHSTNDPWRRVTGPEDGVRDLAKISTYIDRYKDEIQKLIQFAWLSPALYIDKGTYLGINFECATFSGGEAARFRLKFPDGSQASVVGKREHHAIDPETGIIHGFSEHYQASPAIREYYPRLFFSFRGEQHNGPIVVNILEEIVGVGGKPDFRAKPYTDALNTDDTFQRMADQIYLAALAISSDGLALTDVRPVHANNVMMEARTGRFRLFDTDKVLLTHYTAAANLLIFIESTLVNPDLSGTRHLVDDESSLKFAMALIRKHEKAFPNDLIQNGSYDFGKRFEVVNPGDEINFKETDLIREGAKGSYSAYHSVFGKFPSEGEVQSITFRVIRPGFRFLPDKAMIAAAISNDMTEFKARLREIMGLGSDVEI